MYILIIREELDFSINEELKTVTLEDYDHHDNIY